MESSCFLQSLFMISSSSSSSCSSFFSSTHIKNAKNKKKSRGVVMASLRHENPSDSNFRKRREVLFLGVSALPLQQLKARAVEGLAKEELDTRTPGENQTAEQIHEGGAPPSPFLSLLNVVGIISSGVLGALYTLSQKDKTAAEATIESLKNKLIEKETAVVSIEKNYEKRLLKEKEDRVNQINKEKEEQFSLLNQLSSSNSTIASFRKELQSEQRLVEELKAQIESLHNGLTKAGEDKKILEVQLKEKLDSIEVLEERINLLTLEIKDKEDNLQSLNSLLAERETEFNNLNSIYKQVKADLTEANSEITGLKEEILKIRKELDSSNSAVDDLNMRITSLADERDDTNRRIESLQGDYNDLKSSSEKKAASDANLLAKREIDLRQLKEKLGFALNEASINQALITDLSKERDGLRSMLEIEVNNVENLRHELQITQENLETSRIEISDLSQQLKQSRKLCEELTSEVSRIQAEFAEVRESLKMSLVEARSNSEVLSGELASVKKVLEKTKEELGVVSDELAVVTETRENLKKELLDVYKKAETTSHDLKEERKVLASLRKDLEVSEKQILKDKEARQILETELEESMKSLDEVNRNVLMLSRELEVTNSRIANLEAEKDMLYNSLMDQKNMSKEARENVEDAHDLIMKLGKERENSEKRTKKLEEELGSAKGEILRLRSQINLTRSPINNVNQQKSSEVEDGAAVGKKKIGRRKSGRTSSQSS